MDAGDADVEAVVGAGLDGEHVVVRLSLCARSVDASVGPRARDEATTGGDPGWTRETLTERWLPLPLTLSQSSPSPPYACAKRRRERQAARARTRRRRMGIPDGHGRR